MNRKIIVIGGGLLAALALMAVFLLRGDDTEAVVPAPVEYETEAGRVEAFPTGENVVVREREPEPVKAAPDVAITMAYQYDGMEDTQQAVQEYCDLLLSEEHGFVPVDEEMKEIKLPSIEKTGTLMLVQPGEDHQEGQFVESLFSLRLEWTGKDCKVQVCQIPNGLVDFMKRPGLEPLTVEEAIGFLYAVQPAVLGLSGTSMQEYQILALDGAVLVDGTPCLQMNVYGKDPKTGTNEFMGKYLFSNADRSLYSVISGNTVTKLAL